MLSFLSYSVGSILGALLFFTRLFWLVRDIVQKKHSVLRNYSFSGVPHTDKVIQGSFPPKFD